MVGDAFPCQVHHRVRLFEAARPSAQSSVRRPLHVACGAGPARAHCHLVAVAPAGTYQRTTEKAAAAGDDDSHLDSGVAAAASASPSATFTRVRNSAPAMKNMITDRIAARLLPKSVIA